MEQALQIQAKYNGVNYNGEQYELVGFDELRIDLKNRLNKYNSLVVTENAIQDAKSDRANLNKLKKAINDEKIKLKKEAFDTFENQCKDLVALIDEAVGNIDTQVKIFEQKAKDNKLMKLKDMWAGKEIANIIEYEQIHNEKWLNASATESSIDKAMNEIVEKYNSDVNILSSFVQNDEEYKYGIELYNKSLDLSSVINKITDRRNIIKEHEESKNNVENSPATTDFVNSSIIHTLGFIINANRTQIKALNEFMKFNGIKFKQIDNDVVQELVNNNK